ncbi:MAG: hypothetical protein AB7J13_15670 [Pyrinomonadaceae bacterium]
MSLPGSSRTRTILLFVGVMVIACAPIWSVDRFVNQDGSPHLYNAYLAIEILKGNDTIREFAAINPHLTPNLTGHVGLALLLFLFSPFTVTKIALTLLFMSFVASVLWLRGQVSGYDGMATILLFAAAIGLNWLWLLGFYNFTLSAAGYAFTLGLWWRWRERISLIRGITLLILIVFTFLSHIVGFVLLAGSIVFLTLAYVRALPRRSIVSTGLTLGFTLPLLANHLLFTESAGGLAPKWQFLNDGISLYGLLMQFVSADPLTIMGRRALPFVDTVSGSFILLSPSFWLFISIGLLLVATFKYAATLERPDQVRWAGLAAAILLLGVIAPDDMGSQGSYLRERVLLLGAVSLTPVFLIAGSKTRVVATVCLGFVVAFQTAAVWEYSRRSNAFAAEFLPAAEAVSATESVAGVYFVDRSSRFRPIPEASAGPLLGIGKNGPVWDNYEFGFSVFPVTARTRDQRTFVSNFREASTFDLSDSSTSVPEKLARLTAVLEKDHDRIDVLIVWNEIAGFAPIREKWFADEAYFVSGRLSAYRHR